MSLMIGTLLPCLKKVGIALFKESPLNFTAIDHSEIHIQKSGLSTKLKDEGQKQISFLKREICLKAVT